jgi:hypothetical protein
LRNNKLLAQANLVAARAGATTVVPLGNYNPEEEGDDNNSFDDGIDVVWVELGRLLGGTCHTSDQALHTTSHHKYQWRVQY